MRRLCGLLALLLAAGVCRAADVAVVVPADNYGKSLGGHIQRWLKSCGVPVDIVDGWNAAKGLLGKRFAYVVTPKADAAQLAAFKSFRARGGKMVVFYSSSPELASMMGVKLVGYKKPTGPATYSKMVFQKGAPYGSPPAIVQSSVNIFAAVPAAGRGRSAAVWHDRAGRATGDAAIIATDAGWWVTHVFLADGDESAKAQFLAAAVASAVPGKWDYASWQRNRQDEKAKARAYALAQKPRPGEIHAVWDHSGQGIYPGDWPRTMRLLKEYRITDLFVNVCGAGFAHYPSAVLPQSAVCTGQGDQLAACLAAARGTGIRVHAWMLCFTATRATPNRLSEFSLRGWRLRNPKGGELEYLDPSHPSLRAYLLDAVGELARKYPVAGIHLDFVRWYENVLAAEVTPGALTRYRRTTTKPSKRSFWAWRAREVQSFVAGARARVKAARPGAWLTAAVLGKYPSCVDSVGQDWMGWLDAGLIDYAVPMNYTEDNARYLSYVAQQGRSKARARRIISGIGVTANESRLGPIQVISQVKTARDAGLAGVALFDLDYSLVTQILPYLRLGIF